MSVKEVQHKADAIKTQFAMSKIEMGAFSSDRKTKQKPRS
jgi:hypothetical protein